ncbi:putative acyltransferase [Cupriavidus taiwanensis]|nr:putative acyltransferase [Cupriavidus taiwanensis]SOZ27612.1 putative acyltransferase [Cupriavidus taiwanensis]SOZ45939.1 putative acyltransferase [Cupriavidus taiwanensis]
MPSTIPENSFPAAGTASAPNTAAAPGTAALPAARPRTASSPSIARLDSIQALRGLAAALVVLYHSGLTLGGANAPVLNWLTHHVIKRGHVGVDVFFVISGFIIAWVAVLARPRPERPLSFMVRRLCRLAPPYWTMSAIHALLLNPVTPALFAASLAFLPTSTSHAPYYGYPALYVGWSLNYELAFYAVFALGLLLAGRSALLVVLGVFALFTLVLPWWRFGTLVADPAQGYAFASPWLAMVSNPLVLEFLLGCALAWAYARWRHLLTPASALALLALGSAAFALSLPLVGPDFSLAGRGLPAALLVAGVVAAEHTGMLHVPRALIWLGELSYALYLTHPTVIEAVKRLMPELSPDQTAMQLLRFAIDAGLALALAWLLHRWVELPGIAAGRRLARG